MITGGGLSKDVFLYMPSENKAIKKAKMNLIKKEHAMVALGDKIYTLGGYDGDEGAFFSKCEVYDIVKDKWKFIADMHRAKCAFAATKLSPTEIFVCGGYDGGFDRLSSIEIYDSTKDQWTLLGLELPVNLSNNACVCVEEGKVLILGGGRNHGFSNQVYLYNREENTVTQVTKMTTGRDLRNKIINYNDQVYAIGVSYVLIKGTNGTAERFCWGEKKWFQLSRYIHLLNDCLDSWSCALVYEKLPISSSKFQGGFNPNSLPGRHSLQQMIEEQAELGLANDDNLEESFVVAGDDGYEQIDWDIFEDRPEFEYQNRYLPHLRQFRLNQENQPNSYPNEGLGINQEDYDNDFDSDYDSDLY